MKGAALPAFCNGHWDTGNITYPRLPFEGRHFRSSMGLLEQNLIVTIKVFRYAQLLATPRNTIHIHCGTTLPPMQCIMCYKLTLTWHLPQYFISPDPPGTRSANTSRKCFATPLKVRSMASSLRASSVLISSLIFSDATSSSSCGVL